MSLFSFANSKSNLLEVLESFIASHWKHVLIKGIEFRIATFGDHSQHIRVIVFLVRYRILFQTDRNIKLFYWSWKEDAFTKSNVGLADFHKIFSFLKELFLRRFVTLIFFWACPFFCLLLLFSIFRYFQVLDQFLNIFSIFCIFFIG